MLKYCSMSSHKNEGNLDNSDKVIYLVVPCYNEEKRWETLYWAEILDLPNTVICFVNDGSIDKTSLLISRQIMGTKHFLLDLDSNKGKAEAVRLGMLKSLKENPYAVGYLDADAAFPFRDVVNQINIFRQFAKDSDIPTSVWSSRVRLAGRSIERNPKRHYMSRILATFLSIFFKFDIYDTQSGLKIFPTTVSIRKVFENPFRTKWFLDLEILFRWRDFNEAEVKIWEEPLLGWRDVGGSKLTGKQYFNVIQDLFSLCWYR